MGFEHAKIPYKMQIYGMLGSKYANVKNYRVNSVPFYSKVNGV